LNNNTLLGYTTLCKEKKNTQITAATERKYREENTGANQREAQNASQGVQKKFKMQTSKKIYK
jgi:hypothetical protein